MQKKGVSTVIASLVLIILVIIAIAIVWAIVRGIFSEETEELFLQDQMADLEILKVFFNGDDISVTVRRELGEGDLLGVNFIYYDSEGANEVFFNLSGLGEYEQATFVMNLDTLLKDELASVSVAPVYGSTGSEIYGAITDTYLFSGGGGGDGGEGSECDYNSDCNEGFECNDGVCEEGEGGSEGAECDDNSDCNEGFECINDVCEESSGEGQEGDECDDDSDCDEGFECNAEGVCEEVEQGCIAEAIEITCGTWICGDRINNCGDIISCGVCESGDCVGGECVECTPNCDGKECGSDGCGANSNCGLCSGGGTCVDYICVAEVAVDSGVIDSVWPPGVGLYFDSYDLSTEEEYDGYYMRFPGSAEPLCLRIYDYVLPQEGYDKSHVRLTSYSNIQGGDNYEIWETYTGCSSAP